MAGLIANIRQSPTDDTRKRLFELATSNSGVYFTLYQVREVERLAGPIVSLEGEGLRNKFGQAVLLSSF